MTFRKQPSQAQKDAGNYEKGHQRILGMRVSIETHKGDFRTGTDPDGNQWRQQLKHDYGYIRGTNGKDKDHLDVFLGPGDPKENPVHVIDQYDPKGGEFDEHKVVFGAAHPQEASEVYHANYEPGWRGFGDVTPMSHGDFKRWAFAPGRRTKAVAEHSISKQSDGDQKYDSGGLVRGPSLAVGGFDVGSGVAPAIKAVALPTFDATQSAPGGVPKVTIPAATSNPVVHGETANDFGGVAGSDPALAATAGAAPFAPVAGLPPAVDNTTPKGPDLSSPVSNNGYSGAAGPDSADGTGGGGLRKGGRVGYDDGGSVAFPTPNMGKHSGPSEDMSSYFVRGLGTGAAGMMGDTEQFARWLATKMGAPISEEPTLPSSERISNFLPMRPSTPGAQAAQGMGEFVGGAANPMALFRAMRALKLDPLREALMRRAASGGARQAMGEMPGYALGGPVMASGLGAGLYSGDIGQGALQQASQQQQSSGGQQAQGAGGVNSFAPLAGAIIGNLIFPGVGGAVGGFIGSMFE